MKDAYKLFIKDFCVWLIDETHKLKKLKNFQIDKDSKDAIILDGKMMAFYGIITHLKNQVEVFELDLNFLQLDKIEPDKDIFEV